MVRQGSRRSRWLVLGCVVAIALGIVLRFTHLDRSVYWYDETITSIRIAGFTKEAVRSPGPDVWGQLWSPQDFTDRFFELSPKRGWDKTLSSLAYENPEQVPVYYLLARAWATVFGNSPGALRGLSALFGVALLPAIYALVFELGKWGQTSSEPPLISPQENDGDGGEMVGIPPRSSLVKGGGGFWQLVPWTATAIAALSPIQILYAREARGYSLSLLITTLSTLALLKALTATHTQATNSRRRWILYTLSLIAGLYTQLPFLMMMVTHGIFIAGHRTSRRFIQSIANYGLSCLATLFAFSPWLYFVLTYRQRIGWLNRDLSLPTLIQRWLLNLSATLFDSQARLGNALYAGLRRPLFDITAADGDPSLLEVPAEAIAVLTIVILTIASMIWMVRSQPRSRWLLPITWSCIPIPFALLDLLTGGQRSTIPRYFLVSYLGLAIVLGWAIAQLFHHNRHRPQKQWAIALALVGLTLLLPLDSAYEATQARTWWNKYSSYYVPTIGDHASSTAQGMTNPLSQWDSTHSPHSPPIRQVLLTSADPLRLLSLTPYLPDTIVLQILPANAPEPDAPTPIPNPFGYYPPESWQASKQVIPTTLPEFWLRSPTP